MVSKNRIKIVIADDHQLMRQGFVSCFGDESNFEVVGEAGNGKELISLIEKKEPNIVLIDLEMPIMTGMQALKIIGSKFLKVKPIILSTHYSEFFSMEVIELGACAYLPKDCDINEVILAINTVHEKGYYSYSKNKTKPLSTSSQSKKTFDSISNQSALSEREVEILKLICDEKSNKQIADSLNISYDTVDFHRKNIYKKTNTNTIVALIKYAVKNGYVHV